MVDGIFTTVCIQAVEARWVCNIKSDHCGAASQVANEAAKAARRIKGSSGMSAMVEGVVTRGGTKETVVANALSMTTAEMTTKTRVTKEAAMEKAQC